MKIAIIGAGNMGGAIATGIIDRGFVAKEDLIIVDPAVSSFAAQGVTTHPKAGNFLAEVDLILVGVKPWLAQSVNAEVAKIIDNRPIIICSIVANLDFAELSKAYASQPLFRIMPNTAVGVGEGMTFVASHNAAAEQQQIVLDMFATMGVAMAITEAQMQPCMALASCGIAYALRYIRAASEGGVELGMSAAASQAIVAQTLRGAAALLESGAHPEAEIDKVTTAGGITIKGLNAMEQHGFTNAVIQGLKASR